MCGSPFRVWACHLRQGNRGKFCTPECYYASRRAIAKALADGRLDSLLAEERSQAKRKRANWKADDFMARKLADGIGRKVLSASVRSDTEGAQKSVS
jgi:hypothetical protein